MAERNKKVQTILKGINLKVNVIVRLEFDTAYYDAAVQHFKHYAIRTSPAFCYVMKYIIIYII